MLISIKGLRSIISTAFIACLALPGSAFATVMLDLSDNNPIFASSYASGSVFTKTELGLGLDWDLTVTASASVGITLVTSSDGVGVAGNGSDELNLDEWIKFAFAPDAMLTGFTIVSGIGDIVTYAVGGGGGGLTLISGSPETIDVTATASSLSIGTTGFAVGYSVSSLAFAGVPEPAVLGLLGLGLLGMGGARRMRKTV